MFGRGLHHGCDGTTKHGSTYYTYVYIHHSHRVVSMRGYRTTCIPLFYCSRCLVYNSQTTLNAKVRHSQPDYDRLPIFKKKKICLGRIKRAGGVAQGAGQSVSQSTNGRMARQQLHDARRYVAAAELLPMDFSGPCDEMMCWRWLCY